MKLNPLDHLPRHFQLALDFKTIWGGSPCDYKTAYERTCQDVLKQWPTIAGIHDENDVQDAATMLQRLGYDRWERIGFRVPDGATNYHGGLPVGFGGLTWFFVDDRGRNRAAIISTITRASDDLEYAVRLWVLWHEVGHVDDFDRGMYLRPDTGMDARRAEFYAHTFCLERLTRDNHVLSTVLYMGLLENSLCRADQPKNVMEAAQDAIQSEWYKALRAELSLFDNMIKTAFAHKELNPSE